MHIQGNLVTLAQGKSQKRSEKTLKLYLRLILNTETAYNNQKVKTTRTITKQALEEGEYDF